MSPTHHPSAFQLLADIWKSQWGFHHGRTLTQVIPHTICGQKQYQKSAQATFFSISWVLFIRYMYVLYQKKVTLKYIMIEKTIDMRYPTPNQSTHSCFSDIKYPVCCIKTMYRPPVRSDVNILVYWSSPSINVCALA